MWRCRVAELKREVYALALAYNDPRVPWFAKLWTAGVVAYALSPIDLIPDFIPVLGYLDDLVVLPLGIIAARRMIPPAVLAECRARAADTVPPSARCGVAVVIVFLWLVAAAAAARVALAGWRAWQAGSGVE